MKVRHLVFCLITSAIAVSSCSTSRTSLSNGLGSTMSGVEFDMPELLPPAIPSLRVDVRDFGGIGDGVSLNTDAFAKAVAELVSKGGGHLDVPGGIWRTGPISLESNIDLHLDANAVIVFDPSLDLYSIIDTDFEGLPCKRCESPIHAEGAKNVSITGTGVIDGSGDSWRPLKKSKVTGAMWKSKIAKGGFVKDNVWYRDENYLLGIALSDKNLNVPRGDVSDADWLRMKSFLRPVMISFRSCENVLLEGVTFQNSPAWNIHPLLCKNVIVRDIIVRNPAWSQNGDGIDIDACENVLVTGSSFDVGDDAICIKSGKDAPGRERGIACKNVVVRNCTVYHGHGGFVVGSEMSGGVENISVSGCRFLGTDVGLRFKSTRGRGGVVKNIYISDIYMTDIVTEAILFDLFYGGMSAVEARQSGKSVDTKVYEVDETTPSFRDIHIKDIVCAGADRAMYFNGLPEMPVLNISIENCTISSNTGIEIRESKNVNLKNVNVSVETGEPVKVENVSGFSMHKN